MALAEHVAPYPLTYFVDRFHPARGESGVPPLLTNPRAFGAGHLAPRILASFSADSRKPLDKPNGSFSVAVGRT